MRLDNLKGALAALGAGLLVAGLTLAVVWTYLKPSWMLWLGAASLCGGAFWLGVRWPKLSRPVCLFFLCLPLFGAFWLLSRDTFPGHFLFWGLFAVTGLTAAQPWPRRRAALIALAGLFAAAVWYGALHVPSAVSASFHRDEPAPDFVLQNLDGRPFAMSSLEGQVVVLDFFGTWCAPCVEELPELEAAYKELQHRDDIQVLVVADPARDSPSNLRAFAERSKISLPFVYDLEGKAHAAFGFSGFPGVVVMDRRGRIRLKLEGYAPDGRFRKDFVSVLASL